MPLISATAQDAVEVNEPAYSDTFRVVNEVDVAVDNRRPFNDAPTHPTLKLTPDKSEVIRLDEPASTVIVGNPANLAVLPSTSRGLVLVGKQPGATHFMVLNADENIIMQRHVIVGAVKNNYVRVRKTCAASGDDNCRAMQVYYCPDACHETWVPVEADEADSATSQAGISNAAAGAPGAEPPAVDAASE